MTLRCCLILTLLLIITGPLNAQLCQGSLGQPVVDITFGNGSNPGPPLSSGITNCKYVNTDCPDDGYYAIRNQSFKCSYQTWHELLRDHTGQPDGYFMLINASYQPSVFYINPVSGLCPGTTFEFAAWIINMDLPGVCNDTAIQPNITFTIETASQTVLGSYNTGNIPPSNDVTWKQYGFSFQTPQGDSDVVILMTNNAPGGCGNDLALDDITFRPCGPDISISLNGASGDSVALCQGLSNVFTIASQLSAGYTNPTLQWQVSTNYGGTWTDLPNATNSLYSKPQTGAGDYEYRVIAAEAMNINNPVCRINSQVIAININPTPVVSLQPNYNLCTDDTLALLASGGFTYHWSGPNSFTSSDSAITIVNPSTNYTGKYYVTAVSPWGCAISDSSNVIVSVATAINAGSDTAVCEGSSVQLNASGGQVSYNWSPSTGLSSSTIPNPFASPTDTTTYRVIVAEANGCTAQDSITIAVLTPPTANAGPSKQIMQGQSVQLAGTAAGSGVTYNWQPDYNINNSKSLQPVVYPAQDTTYTLSVASPDGCGVATSTVFIKVFEKVVIPNAFSPNGDGINDKWILSKLDTYPDADLYVFTRNGQPVFHTKGSGNPWDGTTNGRPVPFGTYYYVVDLKNGLPKMSGWVEVLY